MVGRPQLIQLARRAHLDVRAQDVPDRAALCRGLVSETCEAPRALAVRTPVPHGQRAREQRVAAEEEPGRPIEQGDVIAQVAWRRQDFDRSVAEVQRRIASWPVLDPEELRYPLGTDGRDRSRRKIRELRIPRPVVSMAVRVRDDDPERPPGDQVLDGAPDREQVRVRRGPRVMEQCRLRPQQEVEERCLEVDALALPYDERVVVGGDDLQRRFGRTVAVRRSVDPPDRSEIGGLHEPQCTGRPRDVPG